MGDHQSYQGDSSSNNKENKTHISTSKYIPVSLKRPLGRLCLKVVMFVCLFICQELQKDGTTGNTVPKKVIMAKHC